MATGYIERPPVYKKYPTSDSITISNKYVLLANRYDPEFSDKKCNGVTEGSRVRIQLMHCYSFCKAFPEHTADIEFNDQEIDLVLSYITLCHCKECKTYVNRCLLNGVNPDEIIPYTTLEEYMSEWKT